MILDYDYCYITARIDMPTPTTIVAVYIIATNNEQNTFYRIYKNTNPQSLEKAKLEILNEALDIFEEHKILFIQIPDHFIINFLKKCGKEEYDGPYKDLVDDIEMKLSLCESVNYSFWTETPFYAKCFREYNHLCRVAERLSSDTHGTLHLNWKPKKRPKYKEGCLF